MVCSYSILLLGLLSGQVGCAHNNASAGDRQLASLREEIQRIEAERDRAVERVSILEHERSMRETGKQKDTPAPLDDRGLRVVRLEPNKENPNDDPKTGADFSDGTRPSISIHGREVRKSNVQDYTQRTASLDSIRPIEREEPSDRPSISKADLGRTDVGFVSNVGISTVRPSALDPAARASYDSALALFRRRKFEAAESAFADFIVRWPDHPFGSNALFWRSEIFAERGDHRKAIEECEGAIARFPMGNKTPDCLLKIGISFDRTNDKDKARSAFDRLLAEYPTSEPARKIPRAYASQKK